MKKYKYFTLALLSVLGLASCDESDYEYTAPEAVQGSQIYFPVSNPAKVELDELSGSFSLQITRIDSTEAINVPLTVKSTATNYTVPESVAFAENQKTADITIDYTNLVYDVMDTITITINSNLSQLTLFPLFSKSLESNLWFFYIFFHIIHLQVNS